MNLTNDQVADYLGNLSVMQLIALTKDLEQLWGVEAKPQMTATTTTQQTETKVEAQTEFNVTLVSYPADKKIALVKVLREVTGLGLLESKNLVESVPKVIKEGVSKEDADTLKNKLTETGAVVEVK